MALASIHQALPSFTLLSCVSRVPAVSSECFWTFGSSGHTILCSRHEAADILALLEWVRGIGLVCLVRLCCHKPTAPPARVQPRFLLKEPLPLLLFDQSYFFFDRIELAALFTLYIVQKLDPMMKSLIFLFLFTLLGNTLSQAIPQATCTAGYSGTVGPCGSLSQADCVAIGCTNNTAGADPVCSTVNGQLYCAYCCLNSVGNLA